MLESKSGGAPTSEWLLGALESQLRGSVEAEVRPGRDEGDYVLTALYRGKTFDAEVRLAGASRADTSTILRVTTAWLVRACVGAS